MPCLEFTTDCICSPIISKRHAGGKPEGVFQQRAILVIAAQAEGLARSTG
jgi:hypothetical protein